MSINPVLTEDRASKNELVPVPYLNEYFVLKRSDVTFTVQYNQTSLSGKGCAFLTDRRIVLLRSGDPAQHNHFTSIELPLHLLRDSNGALSHPEFHQPIFGANYITGKVDPLVAAPCPLTATASWSITFNKGGSQTFVQSLYHYYEIAIANDPTLSKEIKYLH